tara:strand:- start:248 stop:1144 length:897 start_codon:yes stop_codon:yes gene_type:complete
MRKAFAEKMIEMAEKDDKLVVLIGDISHYLLKDFEDKFPDRFYNVGICEQAMVGMAAGLAMEGFRPVIHTIAPFCVERAYEQIKVDLCYQNVDVTIVSVGGSFDYAHLGCTHHCYSDISILRPLPNIEIFCPGTSLEFKTLFEKSWSSGKPKYFKLLKDEHSHEIDVLPYEFNVLNYSDDNLRNPIIFTTGYSLEIAKQIKDHIIVYCPTIEPVSEKSKKNIANLLRKQNLCVTIEENASMGSLGDKIFDISTEYFIPICMKKIAIPRKFCLNYGDRKETRRDIGLTLENIKEALVGL